MSTTNLPAARAAMMSNLDFLGSVWERSHPHRMPLIYAAESGALNFQIAHAAAPQMLDISLLARVGRVVIVLDDIAGRGPDAWSNIPAIAAFIDVALVIGAPYQPRQTIAALTLPHPIARVGLIETTADQMPAWCTAFGIVGMNGPNGVEP